MVSHLIEPPAEVQFAALELVGEAVVVVSDEGKILYINDQAQLMLGYSRHDLTGKSVEELLPDNLREVHPAHRQTYLDNPTRRPMGVGLDLYAKHKTGRLIPVEINLQPKLWPGLGVVVGALLVRKTDATERPNRRSGEDV